jgi:hypothetical protein
LYGRPALGALNDKRAIRRAGRVELAEEVAVSTLHLHMYSPFAVDVDIDVDVDVDVKKSKSFKSFSDEAYGFITCGAEPPHKVKININIKIKTIHTAAFDFDVDFVWRL